MWKWANGKMAEPGDLENILMDGLFDTLELSQIPNRKLAMQKQQLQL
jgi:hypothetical protein